MAEPRIVPVDDIDDPALAVFREVKDRTLTARAGLFIGEGIEVVRRMLRGGSRIHALLLTPPHLERLREDIGPETTVHVASVEQMTRLAGFHFHRGSMACGYRPSNPSFEAFAAMLGRGGHVVALEGIGDVANVGMILRNAAAFEAAGVILGQCCDPYYRRVIRVSMGNVLALPIRVADDLPAEIAMLRERFGMPIIAAALTERARPLEDSCAGRAIVAFGGEGHGLSDGVLDVADEHLRIPVAASSDSLNVAVACGIFLHALRREISDHDRGDAGAPAGGGS